LLGGSNALFIIYYNAISTRAQKRVVQASSAPKEKVRTNVVEEVRLARCVDYGVKRTEDGWLVYES
jgi:hypothetical protein